MCPGKAAVRDGPGKRAAVKGTRRDDPETVTAVEGTRRDDPGNRDGRERKPGETVSGAVASWMAAGPGMELTREKSGVWGR